MEWWNLSREQMMSQKKLKQPGMDAEPLIPAHVLRFLNSMPVASDPMTWIYQFKIALQVFLGDIDRIALFINMNCPLQEETANYNAVLMSEITSGPRPADASIHVTALDSDQDLLERYREHLRRADFPFKDYQPPLSFLYSMCVEQNHLGTIWLFRNYGKPPISPQTLKTLEDLRPFIIFALSHQVTQHRYNRPETVRFYRIIQDLNRQLKLTPREKEILALRLMGCQNKIVAEKLFLSEETISKHVRSILRKGKARTFIELFMRQYVPDLETMTVPSPTVRRSSRKGAKSAAKESPAREQNNLLIW